MLTIYRYMLMAQMNQTITGQILHRQMSRATGFADQRFTQCNITIQHRSRRDDVDLGTLGETLANVDGLG